ncbi:RNA 2',3'-cyclic phosphodiesterase [Methanoregula sp.]|uniref:RNA 2',3'-cyclic phosphodiesterase n=1 Tax=Methanoregula sp. TaxID=2052170 RepID=UPI00261B72F6|nr:RNA 2',3'-cyclic phosphodiesterase [Methanoregula sp.]MDD5142853.1 RNA 2',3'-cyclic phosphodiesterase [Methanoregula sp.]
MVRTFVALELSETVRGQLKEAQDVLRASSSRLTFVDPSLIHITVKFLGEVDDKMLVRIKDALKLVPFQPFPVSAGNVTVNNPKRPHTVWCAIDDKGNGERLLSLVEDALSPMGFPRESRKFTPHATVARVKYSDPSLFAALDQLKGRSYGECMVSGLKLKKSTLTPRGPVYEDLLEVNW